MLTEDSTPGELLNEIASLQNQLNNARDEIQSQRITIDGLIKESKEEIEGLKEAMEVLHDTIIDAREILER